MYRYEHDAPRGQDPGGGSVGIKVGMALEVLLRRNHRQSQVQIKAQLEIKTNARHRNRAGLIRWELVCNKRVH